MKSERLVTMANQIGAFFVGQRHADPAAKVAEHLVKFWDPRMRAGIVAHLKSGGAGLDPVVRQAVESLAEAKCA